MADEKVAIVIDNGSCTTRVGFGGEDAPHVTFPSIVGHPKHYDPGLAKVGYTAPSATTHS